MAVELRRIFAVNLREIVDRRGIRINWLADQAGVSRAQMYNVLSERCSPSLDWISKVSTVLKVDPADLVSESGQASRDRLDQTIDQAMDHSSVQIPVQGFNRDRYLPQCSSGESHACDCK